MIDFSALMQFINSFSALEISNSDIESKPYDIIYLRICNKIKNKITINVPIIKNVDDWVGENRPDLNFNNIEIRSGDCYENEENVAIMTTTSAIFKIEFKFKSNTNKSINIYSYIDQICIKNILCNYSMSKIILLDKKTEVDSNYYLENSNIDNSILELTLRKK